MIITQKEYDSLPNKYKCHFRKLEEKLAMRYGERGQGPTPQQTPAKPVSQKNHHPTVKPTKLMQYLCNMFTPQGGHILDPFMGSGSTGKAAVMDGFKFTGVDKDSDDEGNPLGYLEVAEARIKKAAEKEKTVFD